MFELDFFYEDSEHTKLKELPSVYKIQEAISDIESELLTPESAAQKIYETKMWQWFNIYRFWLKGDFQGDMFEQPTFEGCHQEIVSHFREIFKASRTLAVSNIKVEVDGMIFDGDEISRSRMVTAIAASEGESETVKWSLADNTVANVTSLQLKKALRLSGKEMENIWFQ